MSEKCKQRFGYNLFVEAIHGNPFTHAVRILTNFCLFCFFFFHSLPQPLMSNADLNRIINSEEIQAVLRPAG